MQRRDTLRALAGALGASALSVAAGAGCTFGGDADHDGPDAPREQPLARKPRVAWVLSSGGPRGFTHVGVLLALDELKLAPDLIVGASVGAMIGVLRAAGRSARAIETLALGLHLVDVGRIAFGSEARYSGAPIAELVRRELGERHALEQLPIAMACVAARTRDGAPVVFTAGDAGLAVQASTAVEGRFAPVRIRGEAHADPDWHVPLPVRAARALGAEVVIAVDASAHLDRAPEGAARYRANDERKKALVDADAARADLVIKPDFGYWVSFSQDFRERAIAAGRRDTLAQAPKLKALHTAPARSTA